MRTIAYPERQTMFEEQFKLGKLQAIYQIKNHFKNKADFEINYATLFDYLEGLESAV